MNYQPPSSETLRQLKERLGYTNGQMADLFGVSTGRQFHKYLSDEDKREMGFHVLMYGAMQLALRTGPIASVDQVFDAARSIGATIELDKP
ncbi:MULTISPECIES: XRE family transcriptional regulator [Burkholderia cepacia complex]|uniref:XRE family transcriptional regulator n=1 Tax=Burkholderia cepacia complex TaxID=87882 RepID=UPI0026509ED3|nr:MULTISPECIES: XRE family transcriptional regulator [Burkholderia cepacia complex]MDN7875459.1 XRE family transcriptional regulator [Burkholderia aenigmatica]